MIELTRQTHPVIEKKTNIAHGVMKSGGSKFTKHMLLQYTSRYKGYTGIVHSLSTEGILKCCNNEALRQEMLRSP